MADSHSPVLGYALLGLGAAAAAYLLFKPNATGSTVPVPLPGPAPSPTPSTSFPAPPSPGELAAQIATRLRGSAQARRIFYVQSMLYSAAVTNEYPDGVQGAVTNDLVRQINYYAGFPDDNNVEVRNVTIARLLPTLVSLRRDTSVLRAIPTPLPQDVINLVNQTALAADPRAILLQARTS